MIIHQKTPTVLSGEGYMTNWYAMSNVLLKAEFDESWIQTYHD